MTSEERLLRIIADLAARREIEDNKTESELDGMSTALSDW